ncbi:MAG: YceD family protein [bacterium]
MLQAFLDRHDPWHLCDSGRVFSGEIPISSFDRLAPLLADVEGKVSVDLKFFRDGKRRGRVTGGVVGELSLCCQRCLGTTVLPIDLNFDLVLTQGVEESAQIPDSENYLLIDESQIRMLDLVEDELLLSVPDAPRHEDVECIDPVLLSTGDETTEPEQPEKENPFAVLQSLKRD